MKINGTVKWMAVIITLIAMFAGIIWNAATLSNDVEHIKKDIVISRNQNNREHEAIKDEIKEIRRILSK